MSNISIHGARVGDRAVGKPTSGRMQPTGPELGAQARAALWRFYAGTRTQGVARDRLGVATVRNQYPATRGLFSDAALMAVLREPGRRCSWDYYRELAAEQGEPPPVPSPDLFGLLGRQCGGCKIHFAAQVVADRERESLARIAGGAPTPSAVAGLARARRTLARKTPEPSYYRPGRPW
jgi:hypothetical protein